MNDPYNGKGTDVNIHLTQGMYSESLVSSNGNNATVKETERPEYVGAAHELIHGIRKMKGEAVKGKNEPYYYIDIFGNKVPDQASLEELQTIGIIGNYSYTENKIRKEHHLRLRREYH